MKKYIKFIVLFLLLLGIGLLIFKKYNASFDVKPQVKYSEFEDYLLENNDILLYVTNTKKVKDVYDYFESRDIHITYMYLNTKEEKDFKNKYGISKLPRVISFKDGSLNDYIEFNKETIEDFLNRNGFLQ